MAQEKKRSDHPTFGEAVEGVLKGMTPEFLRNRKQNIDKEVDEQAKKVNKIKARQDDLAGITRRT